MTPAEMREAAAVLVENKETTLRNHAQCLDDDARFSEDSERLREKADTAWAIADEVADLAAAIRALPLPEEALTPREKLRRVREARELLATARVAFVPRGAGFVTDEATGGRLGDWRSRGETYARTVVGGAVDADEIRPTRTRWMEPVTGLVEARRTWVLDTLRAEGWDVVEEGEGDE